MSVHEPTRFTGVRVCLEHRYPYDTVPNHDGHTQTCSCQPGGDRREPKWEGYDFNEWLYICAICTSEAVSSGYRFAPFHCTDCLALLREVRQSAMPLPIPVGRHSLMNGIDVPIDAPDAAKAMLAALDRLGSRIGRLSEWKRERLRLVLEPFEEDPPLAEVLGAARARWTKAAAFDRLCRWWADPSVGIGS